MDRVRTSSPENSISGNVQPHAEGKVRSANQGADQPTATPTSSDARSVAPEPDHDFPSADPSRKCTCVVCLQICTLGSLSRECPCRFVGCDWSGEYWDWSRVYWEQQHRIDHEKSHFHQVTSPRDDSLLLYCPVDKCRFKSKRWPDLQRHTTAKHCINPTKFACPVIECKFHGEGKGFTRKDKLTAHMRSMHQGQRIHGQAVRALRPAPASPYAEASGSSNNTGLAIPGNGGL